VKVRLTPEAFAKPPGGVRRTAFELLAALRSLDVDVSVSSFVEQRLTTTSPTPSVLRRGLLQLDETTYFAGQRLRSGSGVAHSLYYDQQVRAPGWPLVVTVNDMIHERFGIGSASLRWAKRLSLRRASLVITPSRATAADLVRMYPDVRAKIRTIPWAIAPAFLTARRDPTDDVASPFLLYVGPRSGYKNASILVRAMAAARDLVDLRLVLVGGEPLTDAARRGIADDLGADDRVVHVARPSDETLRRLYDAAAALVVTSRCEGFGLPLLEAMARGCPVACADGGSSPEIADGHAAVFPPDSVEACAEAVRQALATPASARELARTYASHFNWDATARAHVDAYRSLSRQS
jgi:glycosyltransferase involved in cell wall biosynthesis